MKARLEIAINAIRANSKIPTLDEASTRAEVIDPVLERLGWDKFGREFKSEYPVSGGSVDYALLVGGAPMIFIEAKRPSERLGGHEDQLLTYSGRRTVELAALTNGQKWWLYLPLENVGNAEARRFCQLDTRRDDVSEVCDLLIKFLSRENVASGAAVKDAKDALVRKQNDEKVQVALPRAWNELITEPDGLLVDLINERVKGMCGVEAGPERIKGFLVGLKPDKLGDTGGSTDTEKTGQGIGGGTGIRGSLLGPIEKWGCPRAVALAKARFGPGEVFRNNTERDLTRRRLVGPNYKGPKSEKVLGRQLAGDGALGGRFNEYIRNHIGEHAKTAECEDVWDLVRAFGTG